ncbi:MAG: hypothetical protein F4X94_05900 [Dehalococcoidia bacterium]|nr:hypothetical protein [Dehalococcoidia bacterium]
MLVGAGFAVAVGTGVGEGVAVGTGVGVEVGTGVAVGNGDAVCPQATLARTIATIMSGGARVFIFKIIVYLWNQDEFLTFCLSSSIDRMDQYCTFTGIRE